MERADTQRTGEGYSRPGIDPRPWVKVGWVKSVTIDPVHGVMCDVIVAPGKNVIPCFVAAIYAGPSYGIYFPFEVDDEVSVIIPEGAPALAGWIVGRRWSAAEKPPGEVASYPKDPLILAKDGATIRIVTSGGGNVVVEARGGGKVLVGSESATLNAARQTDAVQVTIPALTVWSGSPGSIIGTTGPAGGIGPGTATASGTITGGSPGKVKVA